MENDIVWAPTTEIIEKANITDFWKTLGAQNLTDLNRLADSDPSWFWNQTIRYMNIHFAKPYDSIVDLADGKPMAKWCVGGRMNATVNLLDKHRKTPTYKKTAIIYETEEGEVVSWTFEDLDKETSRLTNALRKLDYGINDTIGIYMSMVPNVVAAYFAIARVGAIAVPLFSGFGRDAIITRLSDAGATGVFSISSTYRRGQKINMKSIMDSALDCLPEVRHQIILNNDYCENTKINWVKGRDIDWTEITACEPHDALPTIVDADHPLLLIYTSGTTGKPKGTILTHCGFMIKICFDMTICGDLKPADAMMWISDFGWIVGPMITTSCTFAGATMLLVEGAPDYPGPGRMWRLIEKHKISFLGLAPTTVRGLMRTGDKEVSKYDMSSLRIMASTGEPWTDEAWNWCFEKVGKKQIPLLNISGGTEIGGGILMGTPVHKLKPCSFGFAIPGMGADIFDANGNAVSVGEVGELVLTNPSIGLTRGLWNDHERYIETYWSMYRETWRHGDWASRDQDGMWYVYGRSDDTLKIAGKRTGPAEIEGLAMATGLVSEAAAIGIPDDRAGESVMIVCVPAPTAESNKPNAERIRAAVANGQGKAFRPSRILFVNELPKTRNMKIMRRVVKAAVLGKDPGDLTALVNPESVVLISEAENR